MQATLAAVVANGCQHIDGAEAFQAHVSSVN
jgi:hypothetical protein